MLSWLIGLPLAALAVLFALSNRQEVTFGLWPFAEGLTLPAYLAVLLSLLAGLIFGLLGGGAAGWRHKRRARAQEKRAQSLEKQLGALRQDPPPPTPQPAGPGSDVTVK